MIFKDLIIAIFLIFNFMVFARKSPFELECKPVNNSKKARIITLKSIVFPIDKICTPVATLQIGEKISTLRVGDSCLGLKVIDITSGAVKIVGPNGNCQTLT